jgi:hypothetical protein
MWRSAISLYNITSMTRDVNEFRRITHSNADFLAVMCSTVRVIASVRKQKINCLCISIKHASTHSLPCEITNTGYMIFRHRNSAHSIDTSILEILLQWNAYNLNILNLKKLNKSNMLLQRSKMFNLSDLGNSQYMLLLFTVLYLKAYFMNRYLRSQ